MNDTDKTTDLDRIEQGGAPHVQFGRCLRQLRLDFELSQIDVEFLTREIAEREGSEDFIIRNFQLSAIEQGRALPGPAKFLALGEIYGLSREQLTKLWARRGSRFVVPGERLTDGRDD